MARIKLPRTFERQYILFLNILKKHQEDGAASPLNENFDMDMLEAKATNANLSNSRKEEYERLAELETEARNIDWKLVKKRMRNIGQFLKAKFSDNPHMLGLWGFTVDDSTGVVIKKGTTPGNGVIPNNINVNTITLIPDDTDGTYPTYWMKGVHSESAWSKVNNEFPECIIKGLASSTTIYCYLKADSGSITMNLFVKGDIN